MKKGRGFQNNFVHDREEIIRQIEVLPTHIFFVDGEPIEFVKREDINSQLQIKRESN
jgi:hypothetical protein